MAQSPFYFGGMRESPFGGFNLGGVQSLVAQPDPDLTPNANAGAAAGVSGAPAAPPTPGAAPDAGGGASDSSGAPASSGPGFSVGEAASTAARGGSFSVGGVGPGTIGNVNGLAGIIGGLAGVPGTSIAGLGPATTPFGIANSISSLAAKNMSDPATGLPVTQLASNPGIVAADTNFDASQPAVGNPNSFIGSIIAAIQAANGGPAPDTNSITGASGFGGNGSSVSPAGGIFSGTGTQTGNVAIGPGSTEVPDIAPQVTSPNPEFDGPAVPADAPTGEGSTSGDAGTSGGTGGGGGSDGGGGQAAKRGGLITKGGVKRPSPKALADKLRGGGSVTAGNPKSRQDDVPVKLQHGEYVEPRAAVAKFGPELAAIRQKSLAGAGGFNVGPGRR